MLLDGSGSGLAGAPAAFLTLLDRHVSDARIRFDLNGRSYAAGRGDPDRCDVAVRVHRDRLFSRVIAEGNLGLGEAYMDGDFEIADGALPEFLTILLRNRLQEKLKRDPRLAFRLARIRLASAVRGKAGNVRRHYDVGADLFESFLDCNLIYSCGYANSPEDDLDQLQINKCERICQKLQLGPGQRLLDIGCGFGGLLLYAASRYGVTGLGVTNSRAHFAKAGARTQAAGLGDRIKIECLDFREIRGTFDRIVSVGMLEHVPASEYRHYFGRIAACLAADGLGLVHAIGRPVAEAEHDPFIQKYVFPGSSQPALSEVARHLEQYRLPIWDVENIKNHYAYTVRRWLERFRANRAGLDPVRYDARFQRMFEYYLACGIAAASAGEAAVFQVLFARDHTTPVPLHRV